jgi:2-polyprenyl-3-methyl-5-hydroxy-6-metoxy-1,4-benzoquinol methylase
MKTYSTEPKAAERMIPASCPICGSSATRPLWNLGTFSFARCARCGHVYQTPRPTAGDLAVRYDEEYLRYEIANADSFLNLMLLGLRDVGFEELEASLPAGRSFLDVGCATGALVEYMGGRGWNAQGVEVSAPEAKYGQTVRKVRIHTGALADAAFPSESFDLVHSSHVIEHIDEPGDFLSEIARILKPGGWCVTVTPNTASLQARLFRGEWRSAIADHMHLFSLAGLCRLLANRGLEPVRNKTWGGMAQGLACAPVKGALDRAAKTFRFGDVMAVLARKV